VPSPAKTPAAGRSGGGRSGQLSSHAGSYRDPASKALLRLAVLLLVEGLGVERAGRSCDAGENRQGDQSGYEGLHGSILQTMQAAQLLPVIDEPEHCTLPGRSLSPAGQLSKNIRRALHPGAVPLKVCVCQ
jgi:hypothetical protein